jgi:hypothetical protein
MERFDHGTLSILQRLWRDGAVIVETPMDLSIRVDDLEPGVTILAYRTAIQWDGDIVHRYNPIARPLHQAAHTAAIQRFMSEFHAELSRVLSRLAWCGRGLCVGRFGMAGGAVLLGGAQADVLPALQSAASAFVYAAIVSLIGGIATEGGLRYLRGRIRKAFRKALDGTSADEGQPEV